ncbi:MAG: hypothetical protein ACXWIU_11655 [Limisphaerales bacterium]
MNVFLALMAWVIMGAILVTGVVMATYGNFWLLIIGALGFVAAVTKIGILSH